jgi:hypothetical protein
MGGTCSAYGREERRVQGLVWKPEGKITVGRTRHRWEENIQMNFQEVGCGGMDWIELAQHRDRWRALVNVVANLRVSFSRRTLLHGITK